MPMYDEQQRPGPSPAPGQPGRRPEERPPGRRPEERRPEFGRPEFRRPEFRRPRYPYPYPYNYPPYQQQPSYCPYGGIAYSMPADTDVSTLASQLGVSEDVITSFNPGLDPDSPLSAGQIVCLPRNL